MNDLITVYSGGVGLNNRLDPVRVPYNRENGVSALTASNNVTLDDSGRPGRRSGQVLVTAGDFHSIFTDGVECYVGKTTYLYQMGTDESLRGVRSGLSGNKISFTKAIDRFYYTDSVYNGVIFQGKSYDWPDQSTHVGGSTNRYFTTAPVGSHISFAFGRMFIAVGKNVYYSEPFAMGKYNTTKCYLPFGSDVRMIKPVYSGIFFSDETRTWFYQMQIGSEPKDWVPVVVADYPAIEWSDAIDYVDGFEIGLNMPGRCALWSSPEGAIIGTAQGQIINITRNNLIYDSTLKSGASLLRNYNFIHCME